MNLKAHCDIETGKIYGCKKGSFTWWHEKGHLVFNSTPEKSFLIMIRSFCFDAWMLAVMFVFVYKKVFFVLLITWLAYIGLGLYEEWWCNEYAKKKLKSGKNSNTL
jgi:hypothetical protein